MPSECSCLFGVAKFSRFVDSWWPAIHVRRHAMSTQLHHVLFGFLLSLGEAQACISAIS